MRSSKLVKAPYEIITANEKLHILPGENIKIQTTISSDGHCAIVICGTTGYGSVAFDKKEDAQKAGWDI